MDIRRFPALGLTLLLIAGCVPQQSLRVATYNGYLLSPIFRCGSLDTVMADCLVQVAGLSESWAEDVASAVIENRGQIDVLALNEVWDEEARQILVDRLSPYYNVVVRKIDAPTLELQIGYTPPPWFHINMAGEDSGLMLFALKEYTVLPLPDGKHRWGDASNEILEASTGDVAFVRYIDCAGIDCLSAKGAGLVRLQNGKEGPVYNVVFTHMQADYPEDGENNAATRDGQFRSVETLIRDTLPNLANRIPHSEQVILLGDLNVPQLKQNPPEEWTRRFANAASFFGARLFDPWSTASSPLDRTPTNINDRERLDYIIATRGSLAPAETNSRWPCVQHVTVPVRFANLQSDHNMVHADINRGFWHCNPASAYKVPLPAAGGAELVIENDAGPGTTDVTRLEYPGAMQWFEVHTDTDGTYSIGVNNPSEVLIDVFLPTDMTTPRAPYYSQPKTLPTRFKRQPYSVHTYALPRHFYIRTRGSSRLLDKANYSLYIRRHACASKEDACILLPDALARTELSAQTEPQQLSPQDEAWFRFDSVGQADSGAAQTLKITAALGDDQRVNVRFEDYVDPLGSPTLPQSSSMTGVREYAGPVGEGGRGYLVMRQSSRAAQRTTVAATLTSNLRFMRVGQLICHDETNPEIGSDDVFTEFRIDGAITRQPAAGDVEFDCDNSDDPRQWGGHFGADATIRFIESIGVRVQEGDTLSDDESNFQAVPSLAPNSQLWKGSLWWKFDEGHYELFGHVSRRPNEPAALAP